MPLPVVVSSASTSVVEPADRVAFWEQHNADALVGLTCSTYAPEGLVAKELNLDLGGYRLADIAGNAHVIERAPTTVRQFPKDATFASLLLEGDAFFYQAGECVPLVAGDVVVYDTDQPYLFGFGSGMRQLLLDVPRALWVERCGRVDLGRPLRIAGSGPGSAALVARTLRTTLSRTVEDVATYSEGMSDQILDLLQMMTTGSGTVVSTSRLMAAKMFVAEHLTDPSLCTEQVARAVGVTSRHLNRAFAAEGTTVSQYVHDRRLDGARADLTSPHMAEHRIADIASRWAFASQAHFTRAFRARFGCTPTQVRQT
ncbi:helix-turn-helix domain-containing protein [Pseudonocardia sp. DSM 110487]|uniref:helix-turn-helix domain-containing protein n=1 Tax=Pseudonocardia sp. DSM 110487 TaxID=2865833 RepID=UPI001C69D6E5|nr:helix-turn-helix domain-containing protein [Pseudonocardia sp. DSM 110487]QYN32183.1 helix-turn-helix domain-containing protein [Pseudonocardia sp. DSM 110487]